MKDSFKVGDKVKVVRGKHYAFEGAIVRVEVGHCTIRKSMYGEEVDVMVPLSDIKKRKK
jgi:transcription antitermination factor NusG